MRWTPVSQDTATRRDRFLTVPQLQLHPKVLGRELCIHAYWERLMPAGSHDGWPDDSNVQVSFLLLNQVLWQGFGVGVSVGPLPKQLGCDVLNDGFIQPPTGNKENIITYLQGEKKLGQNWPVRQESSPETEDKPVKAILGLDLKQLCVSSKCKINPGELHATMSSSNSGTLQTHFRVISCKVNASLQTVT